MGLLLKQEPQVVAAAGKVASDLANLNLQGFFWNLVSVTTGNIFGGGFMVAAVYWFVYLRPREIRGWGVPKRILELFLASLAIEARRRKSSMVSTGTAPQSPNDIGSSSTD